MKAKEIVRIMQSYPSVEEQGKTFKVGFFLCTGGTASVFFDRVLYHIRRHTLMMIYPNAQIHVVQHSDDWEGRLEMDYVENFYPTLESIDPRNRVLIRTHPCIDIAEKSAEYLHHLCDLIHDGSPLASESKQPEATRTVLDKLIAHRTRYLCCAMMIEIVGIFLAERPKEVHLLGKHEGVVNDFLLLLLKNAHAERSVQFYAGRLHLSPYYMSTVVKEATGKTAMEWITMFTINLSKHYLADTDKSIKEIADTLHFPDQSTFGRYFKHHMGCSPGEYRGEVNPVACLRSTRRGGR